MRKSFFYLYLAGAVISLALLVYQAVPVFTGFTNGVFLFNALITVLLGYLAFKASRPEKDRELMCVLLRNPTTVLWNAGKI